MSDQTRKSIRRVLRDEQSRLSTQAYQGDLVMDVLHGQPKLGFMQRFRTPAVAVALLGIGVAITIGLLNQSEQPDPNNITLSQQPVPDPAQQVIEQEQATIAPVQVRTAITATTTLPVIDRELLPLQRNSKATWLASAKRHKQQIDKQSRLAKHPNLGKRARLTLSAPTRRTIGRTFDRPLSLKPAPKPERNS